MTSPASAAPITFKAPVEWTDSIRIDYPVWIDANGDQIQDLVGYDEYLGSMVASCKSGGSFRRQVIQGDLASPRSVPAVADLDGDGIKDLLQQGGNSLMWWKSSPGGILSFMGEWAELPAETDFTSVADVDGDGHQDVLQLAIYHGHPDPDAPAPGPSWIGYGDGAGNFQWVQIPFEPIAHPGAGDPIDFDGDGDLDWSVNGRQIAILEDRSVVRVQLIPDQSLVLDLDGLPGAELLQFEGIHSTGNVKRSLTALRRSGSNDWEVLNRFEFGEEWKQAFAEAATIGIGNFDSDPATDPILILNGVGRVIKFSWSAGGFVIDGSMLLHRKISRWDWPIATDREDDGRDTLMIGVHGWSGRLFDGEVYMDGPLSWKHSDLDWEDQYPIGMEDLSIVHDVRDLSVCQIAQIPRLAAISGEARELSVWTGMGGIPDRRVIGKTTVPGISVIQASLSTPGGSDLAWLSSEEESGRFFTLGSKWSTIAGGTPSLLNGTGVIGERWLGAHGIMPAALLGAADFNQDGIGDILYSKSSDGRMVWVSGTRPSVNYPSFGAEENVVGSMPLIVEGNEVWGGGKDHLVVHDMDADGDVDLVQFPSLYGKIAALYENDGTGLFSIQPLGSEVAGRVVGIKAGNFNGSGMLDLALVTRAGGNTTVTLLMDAATGSVESTTVEGAAEKVAIGDFNGDGLDDLALAGEMLSRNLYPIGHQCLWILARRSPALFEGSVLIAEGFLLTSALLAEDLNRDGKDDLVQASAREGAVMYFESIAASAGVDYATWSSVRGGVAKDDDPDGDGLTNFHEYLLALDPSKADVPGPSGGPGAAPLLEISIPDPWEWMLHASHARQTGLPLGLAEIVIEKSSDLVDWAPIEQAPLVRQDPTKPGWQTLEWNILFERRYSDPKTFYRFKVSED